MKGGERMQARLRQKTLIYRYLWNFVLIDNFKIQYVTPLKFILD